MIKKPEKNNFDSSIVFFNRYNIKTKDSNNIKNMEYFIDNFLEKKNIIYGYPYFKKLVSWKKIFWFGNIPVFDSISKNFSFKKIKSILISLLLIFITIISTTIISSPSGMGSNIIYTSILPEYVYNNDTIFVNVIVPNSYNTRYVICNMSGFEIINMSLVNVSDQNEHWQASWIVHDGKEGNYIASINVTTDKNTSYHSKIGWSVLPQNIVDNNIISKTEFNEVNYSLNTYNIMKNKIFPVIESRKMDDSDKKSIYFNINPQTELKEKRTLYSKTFLKEDGSYQERIGIGPIHYPDEDGNLEDIKTAFVHSNDLGYDYEITKGFYKLKLKKKINSENLLEFRFHDFVTKMEIKELNWVYDTGEKELISQPQHNEGIVQGNKIRYPNVFGKGIDFEFLYHPQYLSKYLIIDNYGSLPVCNFDRNCCYLELNFKITVFDNIDVFVDGKKLDTQEIVTQGIVEFRDINLEKTQFFFSEPYSIDSLDNRNPVILILKKQGSDIFISKRIDKNWLEKAVYPIKADPADTIYLDGDVFDMYDEDGTNNDDSTVVQIGRSGNNHWDGYWAFPISGDIIGATINSVNFTSYITQNDMSTSPIMYGLQQENCPALEGVEDPSGYTRTTTSYTWNAINGGGTGIITTGDISNIFNEWISDYAHISPPDKFGIVLDESGASNNRGVYFYDYSHTSYSDHTYLTINYSMANGPPTQFGEVPTNDSTNIVRTPLLNVTVDDPDDNTLIAYWNSNSSGSWVLFGINESIDTSSGEVNIFQTNSNFSNPGKTYWWSVNLKDGNDWNNKTYHFTTSNTPSLHNPNPVNETTDISLTPICNVTVFDQDGGTVDVYFYENTTGGWVLQQVNSNIDVTSPANVIWDNYNNATENNKKYWWKVNISDDKGCYTEEIYHFTTSLKNPPQLFGENPLDLSTNIAISITTINVTIEDSNGDQLNWTIETKPNIGSQDNSSSSEGNGIKTCIVSGLIFGTTYTWYVNSTDGTDWTNETYTFTTSYQPELSNPGPSNETTDISLTPICNVTVFDQDGGTVDVYFYENTTGGWVLQQVNSNIDVTSPANVIWDNYNNATENNKKYWWKVNISDDKGYYSEEIYNFLTLPETTNTSVNYIDPYIQTSLPINITSIAMSSIDIATLYYRWSDDNQSWEPWTLLTYDDFENDFGNYTDGGEDCLLYSSGTFAHQGNNAANIQDNYGDASSFYHTTAINADTPEYKCIKIDFWFYSVNMDSGQNFFVEYYNGTDWQVIATYVQGTDFINEQFYHKIVWINETSYIFTNDMRIKFRCNGQTNNNDVFLDEIYVNATTEPGGGNGLNWSVWNNANNPDDTYPWSWNFDSPNDTGYYEFYSIGNKSGLPNETAPTTADAICFYNSSAISIDIIPSQWNQGTVSIGSFNATTGYYFNLTNEGSVTLNIQIKASNAINYTTGFQWDLALTPGFNNFSLQYNKSGENGWSNINTSYDVFITNFNIDAYQTFDLKLIMATTSSKNDPLSFKVTFKSVAY